ncbi:major histocompatibility complex class I-related gene protein-like [Sardina pilchardus]|uniref:major histocompatibility complex class I-related gene protein-like n=1 Tax=Sardina pilchardus TaxID=27697 RepID=UPI002E14A2B0
MKKLLILILLLAHGRGTAGSHSLWMFVTFIKGETPFPEFSAVAMLDDIQIGYYDTNDDKLIYRGANHSTAADNSDITFVGLFIGYVHSRMRDRAAYLKDHLNHTNNIYVFQRTAGCSLEEASLQGGLISRDAFNGESGDVRYYNPQLNTLHTDRVWPHAVDTIWPDDFNFLYENAYYPNCISQLNKHLGNEKNRVQKKVKPRVRLLWRTLPGSAGALLTCLATGFYPRHINLTLLRDDQPVSDHQITGGELLPNGDETYQMRKSLEVSAEELQHHHYTCTAEHLSLDNKLAIDLERDWDSVTTAITSSALVLSVCCLVGAIIVFIVYKKMCAGAPRELPQRGTLQLPQVSRFIIFTVCATVCLSQIVFEMLCSVSQHQISFLTGMCHCVTEKGSQTSVSSNHSAASSEDSQNALLRDSISASSK